MQKLFSILVLGLLLSLSVSRVSARIVNRHRNTACYADLELLTTPDNVEFVRTPDACFKNLPGWPYKAKYVEIDGLRQAYVDVGPADADPILLLHGQPSWSYLYRYMIPVLVARGHRVIAMDHIGMGRSDKPTNTEYYTYLGHVGRLESFIKKLNLEHITLFAQDWGSLIGLYVVGTNPDWFERVVIGNGSLPMFEEGTTPYPLPEDIEASNARMSKLFDSFPPQQPQFYDEDGNLLIQQYASNDGFGSWIVYALYDEGFHASEVVEAMTYFPLTRRQEAAYDAPFPSRIAMAGPRTFPSLANTLSGVTQVAWEGLYKFEKPFLTIWGGNDPGQLGQPQTQQMLINSIPGAVGQDHVRLPEASHFLQNDQGKEIARRIDAFITANPRSAESTERKSHRILGIKK